MNQSSFIKIQLKMQAHLIFKVYQREKCIQSRSSTLIIFFICCRLSRAARKFVAGRSLPTPDLQGYRSFLAVAYFSEYLFCFDIMF